MVMKAVPEFVSGVRAWRTRLTHLTSRVGLVDGRSDCSLDIKHTVYDRITFRRFDRVLRVSGEKGKDGRRIDP